jgi:serine/threonine-protein kinase
MPLQPGTHIGPYAVSSLIGSGGMGEVYLARDTKLDRDVALKVLPDIFVHDRDRMARFTREAQVLASLNHPNIAAIYGIERSSSRTALVLEYVDGETLAERIAHGPIRIDEALRIAFQIAEALEAAHDKTIVHRDLKPANVKITSQGVVKVLDFGLAKALDESPALSSNLSEAPTISAPPTDAGVILGTAGYMPPEQARGRTVDRRADIWAFGVIFFEMLTARRLFQGETVTDTLAKILERDPDWAQLPPKAPRAVRKLLQRCLTKNVKDRLQAIGDARTVLQELTADPNALTADIERPLYPTWKKVLPWAIAPLFLAAGWLLKPAASMERAVTRFDYVLAGQSLMHGYRHGLDLSPDGKRIAYVANVIGDTQSTGFGEPTGAKGREGKIFVRSLDQWDAQPVAGTEDAFNPFFSPDGQWLGFIQNQQIKKVPLGGGATVVLAEKVVRPAGATWGPGGSVVFAPDVAGGLLTTKDTGGEVEEFTQLDAKAGEISHRLPHYLPDGSGVLFTVLRYAYAAPDWKRAQLWVKSLETGERTLLLENAVDGRVVGNEYLVFGRQGKLFAVRFNLRTLSVTGSPIPVLDGVTHAVNGIGPTVTTGAAQFSVAENGSLLYAPGSIEPTLRNAAVWVDRTGKVTPLGTKPISYGSVRISPDGKSVIFTEYDVEKAVWLFDIVRGTLARQTSDGQSLDGVWSPDGSRIAFRSNRSGPTRLYLQGLNTTDAIPITPGPLDYAGDWTVDGKELVFAHADAAKAALNYDIYIVPVDQPNMIRPLLNTSASETYPAFSPDGHWLAYCSDKSGRSELYVQAYPGPGNPVLVSTDGASEPVWSRDGKELFYRNAGKMMSVRFRTSGPNFEPEKAAPLFDTSPLSTLPTRMYDVSPDGRFLMVQPIPDQTSDRDKKIFPSNLRVVLNWPEELHRLLTPR